MKDNDGKALPKRTVDTEGRMSVSDLRSALAVMDDRKRFTAQLATNHLWRNISFDYGREEKNYPIQGDSIDYKEKVLEEMSAFLGRIRSKRGVFQVPIILPDSDRPGHHVMYKGNERIELGPKPEVTDLYFGIERDRSQLDAGMVLVGGRQPGKATVMKQLKVRSTRLSADTKPESRFEFEGEEFIFLEYRTGKREPYLAREVRTRRVISFNQDEADQAKVK